MHAMEDPLVDDHLEVALRVEAGEAGQVSLVAVGVGRQEEPCMRKLRVAQRFPDRWKNSEYSGLLSGSHSDKYKRLRKLRVSRNPLASETISASIHQRHMNSRLCCDKDHTDELCNRVCCTGAKY